MNKFDLGILLTVLIFMLVGYHRGLVKSILSVVQYFIVVLLSFSFSPTVSKILIERFNLDLVITKWITNNEILFSGNLNILSEEILRNVAGRIINVFAVIILFIVLKIICSLIIVILNKVADLPIISLANKFGGLVLGAFNGILAVYLIIFIINFIPFDSLNTYREGIDNSLFGALISSYVPEAATEVINMVKISV